MSNSRIIGLYVFFIALGFVVSAVIAGSISEQRAIRTMEVQGYSDARVLSKNIFFVGFHGCDSKDAVRFVVEAKNSAGKLARVNVCAGYFKGGTIRVE